MLVVAIMCVGQKKINSPNGRNLADAWGHPVPPPHTCKGGYAPLLRSCYASLGPFDATVNEINASSGEKN